jgi:hypothetical protein
MNKDTSRLLRHKTRHKRGDTAQLAAQLAPLEELDKTKEQADDLTGLRSPVAHQEVGAIIVEADSLSHARDQRRKSDAPLGLEPVVVVILCLMLAFIAFIAWQISQMPAQ